MASWSLFLIPFSLFWLPLSDLHSERKAPVEQGENPGPMSAFHARQVVAPFAAWCMALQLSSPPQECPCARLARVQLGAQKADRPGTDGQQEKGTRQVLIELHRAALPTVLSPSFCRGQAGAQKASAVGAGAIGDAGLRAEPAQHLRPQSACQASGPT